MRFILFGLALVLNANTAHAVWRKAVSDHFIVYSEANESKLRKEVIGLERFDHLLRARTGVADMFVQNKLTVFFVRDVGTVKDVYRGKNTEVAGYYRPTLDGAMAVVPRVTGGYGKLSLQPKTILFHEYAHHLMFQYFFSAAYPAWYVEGFAEFMSMTDFHDDGQADLGLVPYYRGHALLLGKKIPIERLLTASVSELESSEGEEFYGRAWALYHYLTFSTSRAPELNTYLDAVAQGEDLLAAASKAFGDLTKLDQQLDHYIKGRISYVSIGTLIPAARTLTVSTLSKAESAAMLLRIAMAGEDTRAEGETTALALRKIAARYPDDGEVATLLAEAEHDAGHWQASSDAADTALRINSTSARAMLWKGRAIMALLDDQGKDDPARWGDARSWLIKANNTDTEYAAPLVSYYQWYRMQDKEPPAIAIAGLSKALALVPQASELRIEYALALATQKQFRKAINVLQVIANNPHGDGSSESVRNLISKIREAERVGMLDSLEADESSAATSED